MLSHQRFNEVRTDKVFRRAERNYRKNIILGIENVSNSDPKEFCKLINKLSSCSKRDIPMEVYKEDGTKYDMYQCVR